MEKKAKAEEKRLRRIERKQASQMDDLPESSDNDQSEDDMETSSQIDPATKDESS